MRGRGLGVLTARQVSAQVRLSDYVMVGLPNKAGNQPTRRLDAFLFRKGSNRLAGEWKVRGNQINGQLVGSNADQQQGSSQEACQGVAEQVQAWWAWQQV